MVVPNNIQMRKFKFLGCLFFIISFISLPEIGHSSSIGATTIMITLHLYREKSIQFVIVMLTCPSSPPNSLPLTSHPSNPNPHMALVKLSFQNHFNL